MFPGLNKIWYDDSAKVITGQVNGPDGTHLVQTCMPIPFQPEAQDTILIFGHWDD